MGCRGATSAGGGRRRAQAGPREAAWSLEAAGRAGVAVGCGRELSSRQMPGARMRIPISVVFHTISSYYGQREWHSLGLRNMNPAVALAGCKVGWGGRAGRVVSHRPITVAGGGVRRASRNPGP
eukprot:779921-Prymnesium_polylepis.2